MKFPPQMQLIFQSRLRSFGIVEKLSIKKTVQLSPLYFLEKIKRIGFTSVLQDYDNRKLAIFNQLNFFQLLTGIIVPVGTIFHHQKLPALAWLVTSLPVFVSILVLWLNSRRHYHIAQIAYFVLYPFTTCIVYLSGINLGVELSFILYGILSVFFLQDISQMLFSVGLSMVSYFVLAVVCKNYTYQLATANIFFYFFNQLLAITFIFYGLFLIKRENTGYQHSILRQKEEIAANEKLLQNQTEELTEVNAFKNRLFSIIAHDLKSPIYAMKHLFQNMQQYDLPAEEIKAMVPELVNELTYTTSLMENVLLWTRSQMQSDAVRPQLIDVAGLTTEVGKLLRLQAEAKGIRVKLEVDNTLFVFADKDMVNLILRNLLSNAIKYTPEKGGITVGARTEASGVEIYVKDTGMGMSQETIDKINLSNYYTTKGTGGESGTGLGLMLCREFLARNGGTLHIESSPGKGSVFSFMLPQGQ
ncbi:MAG TPA: HAMP domain-containing sensor histidine kinase [Puia sp.]|nr:HAMP domain-containing sensor histidine kinase [Puia sp.]